MILLSTVLFLLPSCGRRLNEPEHNLEFWIAENVDGFDFSELGGDCTNFVSQCIYAGSGVMNFTPTFGWYYISGNDKSPSWSGVEYFYDFMTGAAEFAAANGGTGPFGFPTTLDRVRPGDVIQLADEAGDFYHTLIVSMVEGGEIYVCAHSDDYLDRPLSSYNNASERAIMIAGARTRPVYGCFDALMGE